MQFRSLSAIALKGTTLCVCVGVWELVTRFNWVRPLFLPSPEATLAALHQFIVSGRFFTAFIASFERILIATLLAVIIGSCVGIAMGISPIIDNLLSPLTQPFRYLPITAVLPLLILWFGIGELMRIVFLCMGIVFYFIPLVRNAVRSTPQEYIDVARGFGLSRWSTLLRIHLPYALPQMFDGLIVINGLGWTYVVLAEIVNAKEGLGYLIQIAGRLQRSADVFAGIVLIVLVALISDRSLQAVRHRFLSW